MLVDKREGEQIRVHRKPIHGADTGDVWPRLHTDGQEAGTSKKRMLVELAAQCQEDTREAPQDQ